MSIFSSHLNLLDDPSHKEHENEYDIKCRDEAEHNDQKSKHEKSYADLTKQIACLKRFDWLDTANPLVKLPPIKLLTPACFWFMVCAEYFPRSFMMNGNPSRTLDETVNKIEKQPIQQIIRVVDKAISGNIQTESTDQVNQELVNKIGNSIKQLKSEKYINHTRNVAELKEDYSIEDDLYIVSMRNDLIDMYYEYVNHEQLPKLGITLPGYQCSDSTTAEEDDSHSHQASGLEQEEVDPKRSLMIKEGTNEDNAEGIRTQDIEDDIVNTELNKLNQLSSQNELLNAMKNQDLDQVILMYELQLAQQQKKTYSFISSVQERIEEDMKKELFIYNPDSLNLNDILIDIHQYCDIEEEYLNFLENKQQFAEQELKNSQQTLNQNDNSKHSNFNPQQIENTATPNTAKKQVQPKISDNVLEDLACQICNDGDYTDDDLIVFCSKCNISVHQRCYGIPTVPSDDWICEVCLSFGPEGKYLRCALCPQRGGAMKPSKIPITSGLFQHSNVSFHEFQKNCKTSGNSNKKERYEDKSDNNNSQYYDFHTLKQEFTEEELVNEPQPNFAWCHVTCALWTPECFFDDKNYYSNVKGLENVDKQRFRLECSICHQKKAGSCIQCGKAKCMEAFHPECARRAKTFLEIRNTDKLAYLIYCEKHTPLKLRRQLEHKDKKYKEEILKFCRSIEKSREFRKKEKMTKNERDNKIQLKEKKLLEKKKTNKLLSAKKIFKQIAKKADETIKEQREFQKALISGMIEYLDKQNERQAEEEQLKQESTEKPVKIVRWQHKAFMKRDVPFWQEFKYSELKPLEAFRMYKKIMHDPQKKKEFKHLYCKMYSLAKGIRIITKEERIKIKEMKKAKKLQLQINNNIVNKTVQGFNSNPNQRLHDIFIKTKKIFMKEQPQRVPKQDKQEIIHVDIQPIIESVQPIPSITVEEIPTKKEEKIIDKIIQKVEQQEEIILADNAPLAFNYEPVDETSEQVYCICQRKYQEGDQMMACEKCEQWYHFNCIGYIGTMMEADSIEFVCKFCDLKDKKKSRNERKLQYCHLFLLYDEPDYNGIPKILEQLQKNTVQCQEIEEEKKPEIEQQVQKQIDLDNKKQDNIKDNSNSNNKKRKHDDSYQEEQTQETTSRKILKRSTSQQAADSASTCSDVKTKLNYFDDTDEPFSEELENEHNKAQNQTNVLIAQSQQFSQETDNNKQIQVEDNQQTQQNTSSEIVGIEIKSNEECKTQSTHDKIKDFSEKQEHLEHKAIVTCNINNIEKKQKSLFDFFRKK